MTIIYMLGEFPSASEYFILQELLAMQQRKVRLRILALQRPQGNTFSIPGTATVMQEVTYYKHGFIRALQAHLYCLTTHFGGYITALRQCFARPLPAIRMLAHFQKGVFYTYTLRHEPARHIHAHFASAPAAVAATIGTITNRSYSISAHAHDIYTADSLLEHKIKQARFVVTCTAANKKFLAAKTDPNSLHHIYHGLAIQDWPFIVRNSPNPTGPIRILTVARLVEKKGILYLLQAIALLREQLDIHCTITGDGPLQKQLLQYVNQHGLQQQVTFTGAWPQDKVKALYQSHHLFVLPCLVADNGDRDGLPNVLPEALASGIPVIATPVSAIPELITHRETGLLVQEKNAAEIAAAIQTLVLDPELYAHLARNGRQKVIQQFSMDHGIDQLYALFHQNNLA